jgi:hypothetical protein
MAKTLSLAQKMKEKCIFPEGKWGNVRLIVDKNVPNITFLYKVCHNPIGIK